MSMLTHSLTNQSINKSCQIQGHLHGLNAPWRMNTTMHSLSLACAFSFRRILEDKDLHSTLPAHGTLATERDEYISSNISCSKSPSLQVK